MAEVKPKIAVYVHWPFCMAKCPYCDFNSHVSRSIDQDEWRKALVKDLEDQARLLGPREVSSVFFGGGTPSLMDVPVVGAILDRLDNIWGLSSDAEITLEANPTSVEASRFAGYRTAGVNRVSVGIQALNDADLKSLGRMHSVDEALKAFDLASQKFHRTSFDLIYARQHQTLSAWEDELSRALKVCGDHLSLYQLTIEENTRFGDLYSKGALRGLPSNDLGADMYILTREMCKAAGFDDYEVSNYARLGEQCRHNLSYWEYQEYCGIGPGAHGRIIVDNQKTASKRHSNPTTYLTAKDFDEFVPLDPKDQGLEYIVMGLRLKSGLSKTRLKSYLGREFRLDRLTDLENAGLIELDKDYIRATDDGRLVLNKLAEALLPD